MEYHKLSVLAHEIREINKANGWNVTVQQDWHDTYKIPAILALIHSEVSEALEAFRGNRPDAFVEEMADVVIRVLDCVVAFTPDFEDVLQSKLDFNRERGYRHGGKRV